jgi:predicted ABC-type ATPase
MNVDRVPDGLDDPGRAAETARLTESPEPAKAPRPDPAPDHPTPDRQPPPDQESKPERQPDREHPPGPPQADSPKPAEPRSRQEHAEPPPTRECEITAELEVEDPDTTAAVADTAPDELDEEHSHSGFTPLEERGEVGELLERHDGDSSDQENRRSEEAEAPTPLTQSRESPEPADDASTAHDRTPPLTDKEWSEHVTEVRESLDKARAAGLTTDRLYTINGTGEIWSKERESLHDSIIADVYEKAVHVPCNYEALVAGGLGGAGKTTVLIEQAGINLSEYLTINPDDIKEEMARRGMIPQVDGLSPMEASDLAHEESSHIAKRLANRAQAEGKNLIWDITMSSPKSTSKRIEALRDANYSRIDGLFIQIPAETSIKRIESRHREGHDKWLAGEGLGGRFVPPEVTERQKDPEWGSQNRKTYEVMKGRFDNWSIYDNSVDGRAALLVESSNVDDLNQKMGGICPDEHRGY